MKMDNILIVDDDATLLHLIKNILTQEGMVVQCATSGEEALLNLSEKSFSLMITDLNMPGMGGLSLARNATIAAPNMPIIMMTGCISTDIPQMAAEAGVVTVLGKPFSSEALLEKIRGVAGKQR